MNLKNYFKENVGTGVLATADAKGNVNTAIYARPHFFKNSTMALIMRDRLSRKNLLENGSANYLFRENGKSYNGLRLKLTLIDESNDSEMIAKISRRSNPNKKSESNEQRYLVNFSVEQCFSLIGGTDIEI